VQFKEPSRLDVFIHTVLLTRLMSRSYKKFAHMLDLKGDETVLDFGCGWGALSRHIAPRLSARGRLVGLDTSEAFTDVARKRLSKYPNVQFIVSDISRAGIEDETFDVIAIHLMLHDIAPDLRAKTVKALSRTLKADGRLFIKEPTKKRHGMTPAEIRQLMTDSRLQEVSGTDSRSILVGPFYAGVFKKPASG